MLGGGGNPTIDRHHIQGGVEILRRFMLQKPEISNGLKGQNINTTYPNNVGPAFASSGQTIATLMDARCCMCLTTLLRRIATCWVLKIKLVRMPGCNEIG